MGSRVADKSWLTKYAKRLYRDFGASAVENGVHLKTPGKLRAETGGTGGWCLTIGKFESKVGPALELWLDRYADGEQLRLWYGISGKKERIHHIAKAATREFGTPQRFTDKDLIDDKSNFSHLATALKKYDTPLISDHDGSWYGFYEWLPPPFSQIAETERRRHIAKFFSTLGSIVKDLGISKAQRGQGRQPDVQVRNAVEREAMRQAASYYSGEKQSYRVVDNSKTQPYDLLCARDSEVRYVEVKGTRSRGMTIELTRGEVQLAHARFPKVDLFLVHSMKVKKSMNGKVRASGGVPTRLSPWKPRESNLTAETYTYTFPDESRPVPVKK